MRKMKQKRMTKQKAVVYEILCSTAVSYTHLFELHDQLREYLSSTPGHVPVEAFYTDTRLYKPFPGMNGITLDKKILASVKNFMGEDNVVVK